ncbi:lipase [Nocardioides salsibiostraticola]
MSPQRRRLFIALAGLVVGVLVFIAAAARVTGDDPVEPVDQESVGPVLLLPGYGGNTNSLEVLQAALIDSGRDARIIDPPGDGTGDLVEQAQQVEQVASSLVAQGAPSVDVVGYSAGGVVARVFVDSEGGGSLVRRAVTLASPHHGTDIAALAGGLAPDACPAACEQLVPDSDLLRGLNVDDETPAGPEWVSLWTTDDQTVVPPSSGSLDGAVDYSIQSVCPALVVSHGDVPRTPAVIAMVLDALGPETPLVPTAESVCS